MVRARIIVLAFITGFASFSYHSIVSCGALAGDFKLDDITLDEAIAIATDEAKRRSFQYDESETAVWWINHTWRVELTTRERQLSIGGSTLVVWISRSGKIVRVR